MCYRGSKCLKWSLAFIYRYHVTRAAISQSTGFGNMATNSDERPQEVILRKNRVWCRLIGAFWLQQSFSHALKVVFCVFWLIFCVHLPVKCVSMATFFSSQPWTHEFLIEQKGQDNNVNVVLWSISHQKYAREGGKVNLLLGGTEHGLMVCN